MATTLRVLLFYCVLTSDTAAAATPRVYITHSGGFTAGAADLILGRTLSNAPPYIYVTQGDNAARGTTVVPVLFDAIDSHYRVYSPSEANLFLAFVKLHEPPYVAASAGARSKAWVERRLCHDLSNATASLAPFPPKRSFVLASLGEHEWACSTTRAMLTLEADVPGPEEPWSDVQHGLVRRMQLPFISFVRWSARFDAAGLVAPWRQHSERRLLVSFVGSIGGEPTSERRLARSRIVNSCKAVGKETCGLLLLSPTGTWEPPNEFWRAPSEIADDDAGSQTLRELVTLKRRSVFCIEPPGAAPGRKSIIDSLLLGCIPVFVMDHQMAMHFDVFLPSHFWWRRNASVAFTVEKVTHRHDNTFNLMAALAQLNASGAAARMQATIAAHGHRLVYGLERGHYRDDDAVGSTLRGMLSRISRRHGAPS